MHRTKSQPSTCKSYSRSSTRKVTWEPLLPDRKEPKLHPAVRRVLRIIREEIGTRDEFPLEEMALAGGLSPSRFMHVFTTSVGVPLRPYILWRRLQMACGELMRGASIADAAQRAGFSDAAHLGRTLRRMMGMTPGELLQRRAQTRAAFASSDSVRN
jgi:AraC-like DNA-binding protein